MIQNIISILIVIFAVVYLYRKFFPGSRKKSLPSNPSSPKPSSCGCGSSCPLGKVK